MAGVGFELKKIYGRKTLVSNIWGTFYATMTTIGPAVLSALLILLLKLMLDYAGLTTLESRFFVSTTTYTFLIATVISVFFSAPVSRYISDCIFLEEFEKICPSLFGTLTLATIISGIIMFGLCAAIYINDSSSSILFLVIYYFLGVLVTNSYCIMTYASALKQYKALTSGFLSGVFLAVGVYVFCDGGLGMDRVTSACLGLTCCYAMVVCTMTILSVKTFGLSAEKYFDFMAYFKKYPNLTIGSVAYTLGIFCPTIIYWIFSPSVESVSIFNTLPSYDLCMFMAIIVNMPALVIFVVKVETAFYDSYTRYVSALNSGSYNLIERERVYMTRTLKQQLFFVYEIQLVITVVLACTCAVVFPYLGIGAHIFNIFVVLSLAIYCVFSMYFTIVVFYYFSDYSGAAVSSLVFFIVTTLIAGVVVITNSFFAWPLLFGGLVGWVVAFLLLRRRMDTLDAFLMSS